MPRIVNAGLLILFVAVHIVALNTLTEQHAVLQKSEYQNQLFVLPAPILKVAALDYQGIVSDYLFVKGIVYLGGFVSQKGSGIVQLNLNEHQWHEFYNLMDVSSDLDPYFQDPYYVANAFLAWDAGMIQEANTLLEKGSRYRTWDWSLPFFLGFNYFYFLQDHDKASEKIMEASRRPGASPVLASLASKLAFKSKKTESSILFLEEMIKKTDDESTKKMFEERVEAYKALLVLEKAVDDFKEKFRRVPADIDELIKKKIIAEIPKEPYGGKFYIDSHGAVKTTSESLLVPHRKTP
jgi:hypothetical protein